MKMWFPPIQPSAVAGRSIWLRAHFLGVGAIVENGQIISGPLFREGAEVFILRAKNEGDMSALDFAPVQPGEVFGLTAPDRPDQPIPPPAVEAPEVLAAPSPLDKMKSLIGWPAAPPVDSDLL